MRSRSVYGMWFYFIVRIDLRSSNAVVTCEIKLFQNCFSLRRRPADIILAEIISLLFLRLIAVRDQKMTYNVPLKGWSIKQMCTNLRVLHFLPTHTDFCSLFQSHYSSPIAWHGGAIGSATDLQYTGRRFDSWLGSGHHCIVALGKLLTPVCLCHQAV